MRIELSGGHPIPNMKIMSDNSSDMAILKMFADYNRENKYDFGILGHTLTGGVGITSMIVGYSNKAQK